MPAADRVAGDHRHHRLRQAPDLDVQVGDVEAADASATSRRDVAVSPRTFWSPPEQNACSPSPVRMIDADLGVLARRLERGGDLDQRLGPEGVVDLGPVDRDLGDPVGHLVADVLVLPRRSASSIGA